MPGTMQCDIVTPERKLFSDEVGFVVLPAAGGEMGILPLHASVVAALKMGEVRIQQGLGEEVTRRYVVSGGYAQVDGNKVIILADRASDVSEIDIPTTEGHLAELQTERTALGIDEARAAYLSSQFAWETFKLEVARKK